MDWSVFKKEDLHFLELNHYRKILLAFSGGPDSTFLSQYLMYCDKPQVLIYFNHQLRPDDEIFKEIQSIQQYSKQYQLNLMIKKIPVKAFAKQYGLSIEMAGHHLRHYFLMRYAKRFACDAIATGHHLDDVIETYYMNELNHKNFFSMVGRSYIEGHSFLKPLLCLKKKEILGFLNQNRIRYCLDSTNEMGLYRRNQIRERLKKTELNHDDHKKKLLIQRESEVYELIPYLDGFLIPLKANNNPLFILMSIQNAIRFKGKTPLSFCEFRYAQHHIEALLKIINQKKYLSPISMPSDYEMMLTKKGLVLHKKKLKCYK